MGSKVRVDGWSVPSSEVIDEISRIDELLAHSSSASDPAREVELRRRQKKLTSALANSKARANRDDAEIARREQQRKARKARAKRQRQREAREEDLLGTGRSTDLARSQAPTMTYPTPGVTSVVRGGAPTLGRRR